jgi:gamma-glutamyltranspeptidase/glutathione hydrolase
MSRTIGLAAALLLLLSSAIAQNETPVTTDHAMVVSVHHDATDAAVAILKQGGNAVDAAVAIGFALAVVHPVAGNIGGGGFMLVHLAKPRDGKRDLFIDYREEAPGAASRDMYLDANRNVIPGASTLGYKSVAVPGSVAGMAYAEKHYGKLGLKAVMAPAIKLAEDGFALSKEEADELRDPDLAQFRSRTEPFRPTRPAAAITSPGTLFASRTSPSPSSESPPILTTSTTARSRRSSRRT